MDNRWNRQIQANTTDGLALVNDLTYQYTMPQYRQKYDPWRGSSREYVWTDDAACANAMPELFILSTKDDPGLEGISNAELRKLNESKVETALKYCESCPVKKSCLASAEGSDLHWSVRGGQTPKRLLGQKAVISFPAEDYFEWECKKCGGGEYGWHMNGGKLAKYCRPCSNGKA